jgi:hypothetical protein
LKSKFADKLKHEDMYVTQLYKRKVGRQGIQEHSIRRTLEKWYYTAESEVL